MLLMKGRKTGLSRKRTICTTYPFISDSLIHCAMDWSVKHKQYGMHSDVTKTVFWRSVDRSAPIWKCNIFTDKGDTHLDRAHRNGFSCRQVWRQWLRWCLEVRPLRANSVVKMSLLMREWVESPYKERAVSWVALFWRCLQPRRVFSPELDL